MQEMMCIRWSTHAWDDFMESNRWGFRFVETDIASFEARTKHMGIISLYEGSHHPPRLRLSPPDPWFTLGLARPLTFDRDRHGVATAGPAPQRRTA